MLKLSYLFIIMQFFNMYFQSQMYFSYWSHVFLKKSFLGSNELLQGKYVGLKFEIEILALLVCSS
jgi:hypothetical protein